MDPHRLNGNELWLKFYTLKVLFKIDHGVKSQTKDYTIFRKNIEEKIVNLEMSRIS